MERESGGGIRINRFAPKQQIACLTPRSTLIERSVMFDIRPSRIPSSCFVALVLCVVVRIGPLRAEEGPAKGRPALPGAPCGTKSLGGWKPQEKWVWKRVCEGKIADFNKAAGYGGKLDPTPPLAVYSV